MSIVRVSATPSITAGDFDVGDAIGAQMQFSTGGATGSSSAAACSTKGGRACRWSCGCFRASTTGGGL